MSHKILRSESSKDRNGKDRHFLNIEISTESDCFSHAEWLSPSDLAAVLADPKAIDAIAEEAERRGILARPVKLEQQAADKAIELERLKLENAKIEIELAKTK